ncbi:hypothetical protein SD70_23050 [Gordoniibacillus kamchatkensis]|uniref:Uncharacterized protein n=1 Tax=Gordoniibacillus kamchatkensis TaxID=1590651 RepID=A0ABR5AEB2_9BACL|nr:hypothetical protein [Paenibacillus sp. VKM B-2647]KIL38935.1 hypothetical protein SD70_23050 [Paenibacillus sp. VKM B-2647]
MNRLKKSLQGGKLQLFVSLAANDAALARAALDEGADGLKVHMNVGHRASGNSFGPLADYRDTFREIRSLFDGPLGIVPGGSIEAIRPQEIDELPEIGIDFFSIYAWHMPSFLLKHGKLEATFAIDSGFDVRYVEAAKSFGLEALEASIVPGQEYGTPLSFADLLKYRWLAEKSGLPVIVPSQRRIVPQDVAALKDCGIGALLIGAVATGKTADEIKRTVHAFRNAIDG